MNRIKVPGPFKYRELPEGVAYVGRAVWGYPASVYANPHSVSTKGCKTCVDRVHNNIEAVWLYVEHLYVYNPHLITQARRELAGKTLACWCGPNEACHADILIAIAAAADDIEVLPVLRAAYLDAQAKTTAAKTGRTVWSRDGQWAYDLAGCGYVRFVTHLPTSRTMQISASLTTLRKLVKSGELLHTFDRVYAPSETSRDPWSQHNPF